MNSMNKCTNKTTWQDAKFRSIETIKQQKLIRISEYNANPNRCKYCDSIFDYRNRNKTFCNQSCSASFNNKGIRRNDSVVGHSYSLIDRELRKCPCCGNVIKNTKHLSKFCSAECANLSKKSKTVLAWKSNPTNMKRLTHTIRKHLLAEADNKCCQCGWGEVNPYSGNYALVVDHIDGNSENNTPENLRVLCPNCDSLLPTYKALNKGKGRAYRRARYADGKSY